MPRRRDLTQRGGRGGPSRAPSEGDQPGAFRWIVDGHNAIFAVSAWEGLQIEGQKREARRALEESLEAFGRAIGAQVWIVYDGNQMEGNPDAVSWPHLRTEYSLPPEEADDRIRFLAQRCLREGERPAVVTSDRRTLAASLPAGVHCLEVGEFFRRVHGRVLRRPEKWEPGDLDDVERHFLRNSPFEEDRRAAEAGDDPPPTPGAPSFEE